MEEWMRRVDGYCERTDAAFWSEPVNAATNAAFLIAAAVMWARLRGRPFGIGHVLCLILAAIGVGSFLFHTEATVWAGLADTLPIAVFVLVYLFAASRDYFGLRPGRALLATLAFFPYAAVTLPVFARLPFFRISAAYWPIPLLIALYALGLRRRAPATARGLALGAVLLAASLTFRSLDQPLCAAVPLGTHFLWHLLNAVLLGWMIELWRRHTAAAAPAARP